MIKYSIVYKDNGLLGWIKNLFVDIPFVKKAINDAYIKGGIDSFPLAQKDVLETMRDDLDKQANELTIKKLNNLLSNVDLTKIVSKNPQGLIYIGGEHADNGRLTNLKAEAEFLTQTDLWGLLYETPKELAQRAMFVQSESLDDLKKGKSILYTLSTQQKILDLLKEYKPK